LLAGGEYYDGFHGFPPFSRFLNGKILAGFLGVGAGK